MKDVKFNGEDRTITYFNPGVIKYLKPFLPVLDAYFQGSFISSVGLFMRFCSAHFKLI